MLYLGGWTLAVLLAVLGTIGTWELFGLAQRVGIRPLAAPGLLAAAAIPILGYAVQQRTVTGVACLSCGGLDPLLLPLGALWIISVFGVAI